jgi:hypothetical protein
MITQTFSLRKKGNVHHRNLEPGRFPVITRALARARVLRFTLSMNRDELERLAKPELIDLLLGMRRTDKASRTSSKPPSTDRKAKREGGRPSVPSPGIRGMPAFWLKRPMRTTTIAGSGVDIAASGKGA